MPRKYWFHCSSIKHVPIKTTFLAYVVAAVLVIGSSAIPDVTFKELSCNGRGIELLSDYACARDIVLGYAVKRTPTKDYHYYGDARYMYGEAFTHGKCYGSLSEDECERCLEVAKRQIIASCAEKTEGWLQLNDCFIGFWEFPVN